MSKTHYNLDFKAVRDGVRRDRQAEKETAERHGFYQYKQFVLVPVGQIAHRPVWHPGRIKGILEAIDRGKPLPPINADKDGGKYHISDGIHRYNASVQRGFTHIPVLETVTVDAPEMYVPPEPEKPILKPGTYVKLTEKPYQATSLWARVEEYLGPYRRDGVNRHVYALDGISDGQVGFVGDWHDDKFDVGRPPRDVLEAFAAEDAAMGKKARRVASRYRAANEMVEVKADFARLWSVVHLTDRYLGDLERIRAQPPYHPFEDQSGFVIEDAETDRISVARTIKDALKGLSETSGNGYHVYAAGPRKKGVEVVDPLQWWGGCPSSVGNEYGRSFDWTDYAEEQGIDPRDDYERENAVHLCVPDLKRTREKWLMKPTYMDWLGEYRNGKLRLTQEQLDYLLDDVLRLRSDKRDKLMSKIRVAS